jgi:hypothetical protein
MPAHTLFQLLRRTLQKIMRESLDSFEELGAGCSIFWEKLKFLCVTKTSSGHLKRNISALPSGQQKKEFLAFCFTLLHHLCNMPTGKKSFL